FSTHAAMSRVFRIRSPVSYVPRRAPFSSQVNIRRTFAIDSRVQTNIPPMKGRPPHTPEDAGVEQAMEHETVTTNITLEDEFPHLRAERIAKKKYKVWKTKKHNKKSSKNFFFALMFAVCLVFFFKC